MDFERDISLCFSPPAPKLFKVRVQSDRLEAADVSGVSTSDTIPITSSIALQGASSEVTRVACRFRTCCSRRNGPHGEKEQRAGNALRRRYKLGSSSCLNARMLPSRKHGDC